ncbi:MAG: hypothetical protein KBS36_04850, partial [Bacteroidales bacterium]|nr:hypothetical protein [Candidatus Cryptobacteroides fimicaballi]
DEKGWHPYVKIGNLKWATENIGATDTNPYGTYFAWTDTVGHELKAENFGKTGIISSAFKSDYGFSWANCPFGDGSTSKFKKYVPSGKSSYLASGFSGDTKTVLDLADDAAYVNWGGPWRMPTGGKGDELGSSTPDFTALAKACKSDYSGSSTFYTSTINSSGASLSQGIHYYNVTGETVGVYFVEASGNKLFFPAAGHGTGTDLYYAGSYGRYWSSTLNSSSPYNAYDLNFGSGNVSPQNDNHRYNGSSVRPVSDQ